MKKLNGGYIGIDSRRVEGGVITLTKHLLERQDDKFGSSDAQRILANFPTSIILDNGNNLASSNGEFIIYSE